MITVKCDGCSQEFKAKPSSKRKYCNHECWATHQRNKNMHTCQQCGDEFYRVPGHAKRAQLGLFCSRKCFGEWEVGHNNPTFNGGKQEIVCEQCGKTFMVDPKRSKITRFCSNACKGKAFKGEGSPRYTEKVKITCEICNKVRYFSPAHAKDRKYCSRECADKAQAARISGEGNGRYTHGEAYAPYGLGWTPRLRRLIRERHNGKCLICGATKKENFRALDIHHIDYDKDNHDPMNLVPLCRNCHGGMHGTPKQREECRKRLSRLLEEFLNNLKESTTSTPGQTITTLPMAS